uniref:Uncharacterized protein n=1 Tax=Avena sativa TaxID=4498 RepID=A0ACD5WG85_AVESA
MDGELILVAQEHSCRPFFPHPRPYTLLVVVLVELCLGRWERAKSKMGSAADALLFRQLSVYVATFAFRLLAHLALLLRRPTDLRRRYGAWAVVTGPTSGIGRSMALQLARPGLNIVLVGRDPTKLDDISETISATHGVKTKTVVLDLALVATPEGDDAMRQLREAVAGMNVGVLVNNAGVATPQAVYLHEADVEAWVQMLRVNVWALTEVTAAVLPGMVERGRGAVVNIGSGNGSVDAMPFPLYSVYAPPPNGTNSPYLTFTHRLIGLMAHP